MQAKTFTGKQFLTVLAIFFLLFQSCQKTETSAEEANNEAIAGKKGGNGGGNGGGNPPPPPPPPPPFYFTNCNMNPQYSATFTKGVAVNFSFTKNYVNS